MPTRENWQIGRKMDYPYEAAPPKKQVAYIFDTNKCIACQTCTVACKTCWTSGKGEEHIFWNNVESKPYGGYPLKWDVTIAKKAGVATWQGKRLANQTIFEGLAPNEPPRGFRPDIQDYASPNMGEDDSAGQVAQGMAFSGIHPNWMFYLARICNHCDNPACLAACPRKAIYKREEDGIVLIDQERCRGYQECVKACPYKKSFYNAISRTSSKCIGCYPRVEQGLVSTCTEGCIGNIRLHGLRTSEGEPREDHPIDYIVRIRKLALPLYPQFGTGPNVFYIPPIHVPDVYLDQMFGPGVEEARTMYRNLKTDKKLLGALLLFGATDRIIDKFAVETKDGADFAIGWDAKGVEVCRVPFTEGVHIRNHLDEQRQAYRQNTP